MFTCHCCRYVTKMKKNDTNDVSKLAYNAELGRLDSISIYKSSSKQQPGIHIEVHIMPHYRFLIIL